MRIRRYVGTLASTSSSEVVVTKSADFAIVVRAPGGPEALEWTELETSAPARGEVLIAQRAVGVNFIDTYFRKGHVSLADVRR